MRAFLILLLAASPCLAQKSVDVYIHDAARDRAEYAKIFEGESYFERAQKAQRERVESDRARADSLRSLHVKSWERAKKSYPDLANSNSHFRKVFDQILFEDRSKGKMPELFADYPEIYAERAAIRDGRVIVKSSDALP